MEKELTRFLLQYLLDNYFRTKAEMARRFGSSKRAVQLLLNGEEDPNGGTGLLEKALVYCMVHQIPIDPVLRAFSGKAPKDSPDTDAHDFPWLVMPEALDADGIRAFNYLRDFVCKIADLFCGQCQVVCCKATLDSEDCPLRRIGLAALTEIVALYSLPSKGLNV